MKTRKLILSLTIVLCWFSMLAGEPVKIIFDTDMGPDFDDVGAIAVLHALATKGECQILACCASDSYKTIASTIEAFNRFFGHPEIPVGKAGHDAPGFTCPNHWNDSIVQKFLTTPKTNEDYPSAVQVYRKVLASQPDKSVTIVTVGFLSNLAELLKSQADEISNLNGFELVKKKVKNWVAMAGGFPEGNEFNLNQHPAASHYVINNWPTPVLFSGFEIGEHIFTGRKVAENGSAKSPVSWAYKYNLDTYENQYSAKRNSWDQTAVLCAIRNPEKYFYVEGPGKCDVSPHGNNLWNPENNANHYFLARKYPYQKIADILDDLMMYEPKN